MRRTAAWKPVSIVAASAIAFTGLAVTPAVAAEGDPSQALAQVLGADVLGAGVIDAGTAYAATSNGEPDLDDSGLDVTLLEALSVQVPGGVQLPLLADEAAGVDGLLDLGQLGAVANYARTDSLTSSYASSGVIGPDGAIAVDDSGTPTVPSATRLEVTALLDQLGLSTDGLVDELAFQIGAVASSAEWTGLGFESDYLVADLGLDLQSELVAALSTNVASTLDGAATTVDGTLEGIAGTEGALTTALGLLDLDLDIAGFPLAAVGLSNSTVTVETDLSGVVAAALGGENAIVTNTEGTIILDLTAGTIAVDVAELYDSPTGSLNGLAPNSEVFTTATVQAITAGVSDVLDQVADNVTDAVDAAIDSTAVGIDVNLAVTLAGLSVGSAQLTIDGSVAELLAGEATTGATVALLNNDALSDLLEPALQIVAGDLLALLDLTTVVDELKAGVGTTVAAPVQTLLTQLAPVLDTVLRTVATITINEQPTLDGGSSDLVPDLIGSGGFTVRALGIDLLPALDPPLVSVPLASSSVLAQLAPPGVTADPDVIDGGSDDDEDRTVTLTGEGFSCGPVTLTITGPSGYLLTDVATNLDTTTGVFSYEWVLPAGSELGDYTVVATTPATCGIDPVDDVVQVIDPALTADPTPVQPDGLVEVEGSGWAPSTDLSLVVSDSTGQIGDPIPVTTTGDGGFVYEYVVPEGQLPDTLTFTATQGSVVRDSAVQVIDPTITADPLSLLAGGDVTLGGGGWLPGVPVTVTATGPDDAAVGEPIVATIGAGGELLVEEAFTVPSDFTGGTVTFTATQGGATAFVDVDVAPTAVDPTLTVTPTTALPGDEVALGGGGWTPGFPVTITPTIDGVDGDPITATVGEDGALILDDPYLVPAEIEAPVTIEFIATQGAAEATAELDVSPTAVDATLTAEPGSVLPGQDVTLTGGDWTPGFDVTITASTNDGTTTVGEPIVATVDAEGNLVVPTTFTVPTTVVGPITLTFTGEQGLATATDTVDVAPTAVAPTLTAEPGTALPGDTITVGGTGWTPGFPVELTVTDANDDEVGTFTLTPTAEGVITLPDGFELAEGTPAGDLTFEGTQGEATASDVVEVSPTAVDATLTAEPGSVLPGQDVTLTGDGWTPGFDVTITATVDGATVGDPIVATVGDDGILAVPSTFEVPTDLEGPATLTFTGQQGLATATDTVDVAPTAVDPTLTAEPGTALPGDTITVGGTGWTPGFPVAVTVTDANDVEVGTFSLIPTAEGVITLPEGFTIADDAPTGDLTFVGTQGAATASDVVVVSPTAVDPTLTAEPGTVLPGDEVTLAGDGWTPGFDVTITATVDGATVGDPIVATVGDDGILAVPSTFEVPTDLEGPATLTFTGQQGLANATDTVDVAPTAVAPTLTVTPTTALPGDEVALGGGGWTPGFPVTITPTIDGAPFGDPITATVGDDGALILDGPYLVPAEIEAPATIEFVATQGEAEATAELAVSPTAVAPTLTAEPGTALPGDEIAIAGTAWTPGFPVTITVTGDDEVEYGSTTAEVAEDGSLIIESPYEVPAEIPTPITLTFTGVQGLATAEDAVDVSPTAVDPELTATPSTALPGQEVVLGGSGWTPGFPVTITVTAGDDSTPIGEPITATVGADGELIVDEPYTVPLDIAAPTAIAFTATQGLASDTATVDVAPTAVDPTLTVEPGAAKPGDVVTVGGGSWTPGFPVEVVVTDETGTVVGSFPVTPNDDGSLPGTPYTVPEGAPAGELTFTGTQGEATASETLDVRIPDVVVEPNPTTPGSEIAITGSGYTCGPVDVQVLDGETVLLSQIGVPVADDGTWTVSLTLPDDVAADSLTVVATATGVCGDGAEEELEIRDPFLSVVQDAARAGDIVDVVGGGWLPDEAISIAVSEEDGTLVETITVAPGAFVAAAVVDGAAVQIDGAYELRYQIPADVAPGELSFVATQREQVESDVLQVLPTPVIDVDPEGPVTPGTEVSITGSGFSCGPATVTIANGAGGVLATLGPFALVDGGFAVRWTVPNDVDPTTLTITASTPTSCGDGATVQLRVVAAGTPGATGPGALPQTGDEIATTLAILAALMLLLGATLRVAARRRA